MISALGKEAEMTEQTDTPESSDDVHVEFGMTWGAFGQYYKAFAEGKQVRALMELRPELAKACAAAEALNKIRKELPDHLQSKVSFILTEELTKQGY